MGLYLAASALVGLSVTYYYDDPGNAKLNTILERGLQLGGLALVRARLATYRAGCVLRDRDSPVTQWRWRGLLQLCFICAHAPLPCRLLDPAKMHIMLLAPLT